MKITLAFFLFCFAASAQLGVLPYSYTITGVSETGVTITVLDATGKVQGMADAPVPMPSVTINAIFIFAKNYVTVLQLKQAGSPAALIQAYIDQKVEVIP